MRELKFKAYIGKFKNVFDVICIYEKLKDEDFYRVFIDKPIENGEAKNYRIDGKENFLMQYTGLKRSGNEIYEGDIIGEPIVGEESEVIGVVKYDEDLFVFVLEKENGGWVYLHEHLLENKHHETIGNKFKNPELIK